jgi:hypothetical protein
LSASPVSHVAKRSVFVSPEPAVPVDVELSFFPPQAVIIVAINVVASTIREIFFFTVAASPLNEVIIIEPLSS